MKYFIANWKMNLGFRETLNLIDKVKNLPTDKFRLILAPSAPMLKAAGNESGLDLAAQDCSPFPKGAFTGEVSAATLKEVGCSFAIIGHSERRYMLDESEQLINQKVKQAWRVDLTPILCFGERESEKDNRDQVIINQLKSALAKLKPKEKSELFLAYEPVWAIGTGKNCSPDDVVNVARATKRLIANMYGSDFFDEKVKFLYGGSVDSKNIKEYLKKKEIRGFLVGKTSLDVAELEKIFKKSGR
ncbi:MAG TPA: triose-phosphate isomerase [Candidatus Bipolaricaulota bacterium]|nr:triose-phosphate isomerase [Candidatus Bipolaricaulota bacterium]